jgi:predicted ATPase/DNA-binding CsgD family transcriptional regulator
MVTAVERSAVAGAAANLHGFPAVLTSFVGRTRVVDEVAAQLDRCRLVTVTGPGGAGKTRVADEVARQLAGRFADGVWLAELATVRDPAQVALCVGAALGIRDLPSVATADALAQVLARRQLLLVLDNCEHVIGAAAELCGRLLLGADDVRVLATSREPLRIAGELRYRLGPLTLPDPGDAAAAGESEAVTLFADRARQVDPGFVLDAAARPLVARLARRLDGLPLAIELAAARVDALGVAQLLDRIDDRFRLLMDADRLADERQRSLAAAVRWSYELLDDAGRRAFRAVSAFPGPFTLEGAEAVAGPGTEPAVLRLVDCSLLSPPRLDPDGRSRYQMLETLRAYGAGLLAAAGEDGDVNAALAGYAAAVAEQAAAGLHTGTGEAASLRRLDAEDATVRHALAWAMDHDPAMALRLALAIEPWWQIRGRLTSQAPLLAAAAEHAEPGGDQWCAARLCLGQAASQLADGVAALEHFTAVRDALEGTGRRASPTGTVLLVLCLCGQSGVLMSLDRTEEVLADGRRAVALARELGSPGLEAMALACLATGTRHVGDLDGALRLVRQAQQIPGDVAGALQRALGVMVTGILIEAGDLTAAERACADGLAWCREAGDLTILSSQLWHAAVLDLRAGRTGDAAAHLREQLQIAIQTGLRPMELAGLDGCGQLCAVTGRQPEAVTMWAARSALGGPGLLPFGSLTPESRDELLRKAQRALGPAGTRAARERGASMSLAAATAYALMLTDAEPRLPAADGAAAPGQAGLSPRERELVTLVAQGRTDAQIAAQLFITVRTVSSHLDRIRDKTGCRRRADLTRLALRAGLV